MLSFPTVALIAACVLLAGCEITIRFCASRSHCRKQRFEVVRRHEGDLPYPRRVRPVRPAPRIVRQGAPMYRFGGLMSPATPYLSY